MYLCRRIFSGIEHVPVGSRLLLLVCHFINSGQQQRGRRALGFGLLRGVFFLAQEIATITTERMKGAIQTYSILVGILTHFRVYCSGNLHYE